MWKSQLVHFSLQLIEITEEKKMKAYLATMVVVVLALSTLVIQSDALFPLSACKSFKCMLITIIHSYIFS